MKTKKGTIRKKIINGTIYKTLKYRIWRKKVYRRDKFKCKMCGAEKTYLNAHHIRPKYRYPHLMFNVSNGITLCLRCHKMVSGDEMRWVNVFKKLLKRKVTVKDIKK